VNARSAALHTTMTVAVSYSKKRNDMNILRKIGIVGMLSGMAMMVFGTSEAAFCLGPNTVVPPYRAMPVGNGETAISCTTAAPQATGDAFGVKAVGSQPTICSNLRIGPNNRRASVTGYNSAGSQIAGCTKHDSVADGVRACVACPTATQYQLTVFNFS